MDQKNVLSAQFSSWPTHSATAPPVGGVDRCMTEQDCLPSFKTTNNNWRSVDITVIMEIILLFIMTYKCLPLFFSVRYFEACDLV